ncbi:MAG: tol-pal system protein YbgF [Pseudomonadales bacterium]|jgi:tol-pal system protein YbgF
MTKLFNSTLRVGVIWGVLMHSPFLLAQAQVIDVSQQVVVESASVQAGGNLAYEVQQLQQEVRDLRGILEEQQYAIRRLQQSRLDDYRNIDKRLLELQQGGVAAQPTTPAVANPDVTPIEVTAIDAKQAYDDAYANIKKQDFEQAVIAFEIFIPQYPESTYAGNAYYWLGELYVLRGDLDLAKASYLSLLENFPAHRKVPDASYKLARVYHEQGNGSEAKALLEKVIADNVGESSGTVQLVKDFLSKNYP